MDQRWKLGVMAVLWFSMMAGSAPAAVFTVDGALDDWGVGILTGATKENSGGLNSFAGDPGLKKPYGASDYTGLGSGFSYAIEDTNDVNTNYYYVGPNYGGQNYDVEFLGVAIQGGNLVIGIMSGQRPDNGWNKKKGLYSPGDIRIDMEDGSTYGLEVGGGPINSGALQISLSDPGTTYNLFNSGFTQSVSILPTGEPNAQTAGSLWEADIGTLSDPVDWIYDPITPKTTTQFEGGTKVGDATNYIFKFTADTSGKASEADLGEHSVIEAKIPLSLFDGGTVRSVTWSASCGNDVLKVDVDVIPEPASVLVWFTLASVALVFRRYRSFAAATS